MNINEYIWDYAQINYKELAALGIDSEDRAIFDDIKKLRKALDDRELASCDLAELIANDITLSAEFIERAKVEIARLDAEYALLEDILYSAEANAEEDADCARAELEDRLWLTDEQANPEWMFA